MKIRIATRRSALALAQTRMMAARIRALRPDVETEEVQLVTEGDRVQDRSLAAIGGKGLFIKELEAALLEQRADLAIHSMKDVPADLAPGLAIVCVPERESPWDLWITRDGSPFESAARGARVGTSSLRRRYQLAAHRPDLQIEMLRGNVDTRLRKLAEGQFDAIILAEAGVRRLGLTVSAHRLDRVLVPAVGQGALALEARADDQPLRALLAAMNHRETDVAVQVERSVLRTLGGSCVIPIGAIAELRADGQIAARGFFANEDGTRTAKLDADGSVDRPDELGVRLAERLRERLG
jgi:hydroxymethylbilane synthase